MTADEHDIAEVDGAAPPPDLANADRKPGYLAGGVVRLVDPAEMEGRTLRLPDPNDPIEAPLAAANRRSRSGSSQGLAGRSDSPGRWARRSRWTSS